ncbi:MAG: helix-turn-helix domain-containing protein [Proteobacteria bacterium]|nr:helix-turn-helix domain-containing protein [Pseudomonadota bacterium]
MKNKKMSVPAREVEDKNISNTSSSPIGALLRKKREEHKIPLDKASQQLCIRKAFLKAIEEGDTENLPERVYTLGFVKSYATYLELDKDSILLEYQKENNTSKEPDFSSFPDALPKKSTPSYLSYLIGLIIIILGIGLWIYFNSDMSSLFNSSLPPSPQPLNSTPVKTIELPSSLPSLSSETKEPSFDHTPLLSPDQNNNASSSPESSTETSLTETSSIEDFPSEKNPSESSASPLSPSEEDSSLSSPAAPPEILLTAKERVWVQITNASGVPSYTKIMQPGEFYKLPSGDDAYLTIGNAGGLEISLDHKVMPPLGKSGQVIRNFSLNSQKLLEQLPPKIDTP